MAGLRIVSQVIRTTLPYAYLRELPNCRSSVRNVLRYVFQGSDRATYAPNDTLLVDINKQLLEAATHFGGDVALVPTVQIVKKDIYAPLTDTGFAVYVNSYDGLDPRERHKKAVHRPLPARSEAEKHVEQQTALLRRVRYIGDGDAGGTPK